MSRILTNLSPDICVHMQAQFGQDLLPGISFSGLLSLHKLLAKANLQSGTQASMDRVDEVRAILDYF